MCFFCACLLKEAHAQNFGSLVQFYSTETSSLTFSDSSDQKLTIKQIDLAGNKRTRSKTILRELPFAPEESYPLDEIVKKLEVGKRQLMNTGLFRNVVVKLNSVDDKNVAISVTVEEKWYLYPRPFVRLAQGNFAQWNDNGRRLDQLNYGIKFTQYNFSGRNDKMDLNVTAGFTKKLGLQYHGMVLDKDMKWTSNVSVAYGKNREISYATENNRRLSLKNNEGFLYQFFQSAIDVIYRPAIKTRHSFTIGYNHDRIADTIHKLNEDFSYKNENSVPYFTYTLSFIDLDFNPYPTNGRIGELSLHKAGFNRSINLWQLSAKGSNYWPVAKKSFFNLAAMGMVKLPFKQPFITQHFLGGGASLQGYENYVIDGVAGGYLKASLGRNIINTQINLPNNKLFKSLRTVPLKVYAKTFANMGYVHNPNSNLPNELNNRALYSAGLGLDIVAFTDLVIKLEWSFNQLGQNGLFLHQSSIY